MNKLVLLFCSMIACMPSIYAMDPLRQMQLDHNGIPLPSWVNQHNAQPDQNWWARGHVINPRKIFLSDLIGMGESNFRSNAHWSIGNPFSLARAPHWINDYCDSQGNYRRAAIFQGQFNFLSNQDLDRTLAQHPLPMHRPYFSILFPDPLLPWESDIRYLQSVVCNKNAVFQIASTFFGPLEGGMAKEKAKLWKMFPHAAQGEEASAATAGATFWRKYCMGKPEYLLKHLQALRMVGDFSQHKGHSKKPQQHDASKGPKQKHGKNTHNAAIDQNAVFHYQYQPGDESHVAIGLHADIAVTSGYGTPEASPDDRGNNPQQRLPVYTKTTPNGQIVVDTTRSQIVSQVFTAALNLNHFIKNGILTQNVVEAAKMLLRASYAATLKATAAAQKSRVFLTLMGGGAFKNNLAWITEAIQQRECIDTIKQHGLQVTLLYRPDKIRKDAQHQQGEAPAVAQAKALVARTPEKDLQFLQQMLLVFDTVNGTQIAHDPELNFQIQSYIDIAYQYQQSKHSPRANPMEIMILEMALHQLAEQINMQLMWAPYHGAFHQSTSPSSLAPTMTQPGSYATTAASQPAPVDPFATTPATPSCATHADPFATAPAPSYVAPAPSAHHSTRGGLEQQFAHLGFDKVRQPARTRTLTHDEHIELDRIVTEVNTVIVPDLQKYKAGVKQVITRIITKSTNAALINQALDQSKKAHAILENINGLIAQLNQAVHENDINTVHYLHQKIIRLCQDLQFHKKQILSLKRNLGK